MLEVRGEVVGDDEVVVGIIVVVLAWVVVITEDLHALDSSPTAAKPNLICINTAALFASAFPVTVPVSGRITEGLE